MSDGQEYFWIAGAIILFACCACGRLLSTEGAVEGTRDCYLCKVNMWESEFYDHRLKCNDRNWDSICRYKQSKVSAKKLKVTKADA